MDEPTKEAIEGARMFLDNVRDGFSLLSYPADTPLTVIMDEYHRRIAVQLADVRKKARDDALEGAKFALDDERVDGTVSPEDAAYNAAIDHCIKALDALKDKPDGEA